MCQTQVGLRERRTEVSTTPHVRARAFAVPGPTQEVEDHPDIRTQALPDRLFPQLQQVRQKCALIYKGVLDTCNISFSSNLYSTLLFTPPLLGLSLKISEMARASRTGRSRQYIPSHKVNSAVKRRSHKTKTSTNFSDVYEYKPQKVRRDKVAPLLDQEEAAGYGLEIDDEFSRDTPRARLIGENVEDEKIDEDDDEELDSDAAFEESDEDRFAGFAFVSSKVSFSCRLSCIQTI